MQVVFDFANSKVEVSGEGPELVELFGLIREIAPRLPSITFSTAAANMNPRKGAANGTSNGDHAPGGGGGETPSQTLRQFVRSLTLNSLSEKIAAVAYYQARYLNTAKFAPKDMNDWFTQCGMEKPSQMPVAVFDAKKKNGYVDNAGHGAWKLSTQGENLIIRKIEEAGEKKD